MSALPSSVFGPPHFGYFCIHLDAFGVFSSFSVICSNAIKIFFTMFIDIVLCAWFAFV